MKLLNASDFQSWLGQKVQVTAIPKNIFPTLCHIDCDYQAIRGLEYRQPFRLIFRSEMPEYLIDGNYEFDCGNGGPHIIFISQLVPRDGFRFYQAVFS